MAKLALHHNRTPLELNANDLEEYLYLLIQTDTASQSSFKHPIYGLRKLYKLYDKEELQLSLLAISRPKKLQDVLFRHTYATHQLEAGQNIMSVKNALGHVMIETTLMYLHIARIDPGKDHPAELRH